MRHTRVVRSKKLKEEQKIKLKNKYKADVCYFGDPMETASLCGVKPVDS